LELDDQVIGTRFPAEARDFLFAAVLRSVLGRNKPVHWFLWSLSPEVKQPGREDNHILLLAVAWRTIYPEDGAERFLKYRRISTRLHGVTAQDSFLKL
jgi:hypothetical protein